MQSGHKATPATLAFFYGKRETNGTTSHHGAPPLTLLSGAFFNKKARNSEKSGRSHLCALHTGSIWLVCQSCRRHTCSDCLHSGEHSRACNPQITPEKLTHSNTQLTKHLSKLMTAYEKTVSDLQLSQITTVSQIEDCFNSFIFEIEGQKNAAILAVKTHFSSAGKKLECLKEEADRVARRSPIFCPSLEQQVRGLLAGVTAFVSQNRFIYEFDKSRLEAIKNCFKIAQSTCSLVDEPNLLNFSIDGEDFMSLMTVSKPNSMVFDQAGAECKPMGEGAVAKLPGRQYSSSRKRNVESREESGSLFNVKAERNVSHFQSVYAALAKDKMGKKMVLNKENVSFKTKQINAPYGCVGAVKSTGDCAVFNTPEFHETKQGGFAGSTRLGNDSKISFFNSCSKFVKPVGESESYRSTGGPLEVGLANLGLTSTQLIERLQGEAMPQLIRVVDVSGNPLEDRGTRQFLKGLTQFRVEKLACNQTGLTELALDYFISFRKYNDRLQSIWLRGNGIDETKPSVAKKLRILRDWDIRVHL